MILNLGNNTIIWGLFPKMGKGRNKNKEPEKKSEQSLENKVEEEQ